MVGLISQSNYRLIFRLQVELDCLILVSTMRLVDEDSQILDYRSPNPTGTHKDNALAAYGEVCVSLRLVPNVDELSRMLPDPS